MCGRVKTGWKPVQEPVPTSPTAFGAGTAGSENEFSCPALVYTVEEEEVQCGRRADKMDGRAAGSLNIVKANLETGPVGSNSGPP